MRKGPMLVAFLAAVVVAAGCASTSEPTADAPESETYVLVHGSAHGGGLEAGGRAVASVRAPGLHTDVDSLGERSHLLSPDVTLDVFVQDIVNVLECEELTDVVLVGHSFGVTDPDDARWLTKKMTPHPVSTYQEALNLEGPVGNGLPVTYVAATRPVSGPVVPSADFVRNQKGWEYVEIEAAHHLPVIASEEVVDVLANV